MKYILFELAVNLFEKFISLSHENNADKKKFAHSNIWCMLRFNALYTVLEFRAFITSALGLIKYHRNNLFKH